MFLGGLGIHRFFLGELETSFIDIPYIIEAIYFLCMSEERFQDIYGRR